MSVDKSKKRKLPKSEPVRQAKVVVGAAVNVRSDSPFTKRSGDMVYNSLLD